MRPSPQRGCFELPLANVFVLLLWKQGAPLGRYLAIMTANPDKEGLAPDGPPPARARRRFGGAGMCLWLARVVGRRWHPALAEKIYRGVLSRQPDRPDALTGLGSLLMRQRRFEEAASLWRSAIAAEPDSPSTLFQLARARHRLGQLEEAADAYLGVASLDDTHAKALAALEELSREYLQGVRRQDGAGKSRALAIAGRLAAIPGEPPGPRALARLIAKRVSFEAAAMVLETPDVALSEFELALTIAADLPEALRGAAVCLERLGRLDRALAMLEQVVRLEPDAIEPRLQRDRIHVLLQGPARRSWAEEERQSALRRARLLLGDRSDLEALSDEERDAALARAGQFLGHDTALSTLDPKQRHAALARAQGLLAADGGADADLASHDAKQRHAVLARAQGLLAADGGDAGLASLDEKQRHAVLARAQGLLTADGGDAEHASDADLLARAQGMLAPDASEADRAALLRARRLPRPGENVVGDKNGRVGAPLRLQDPSVMELLSQLGPEERQVMLARARRLADGGSPAGQVKPEDRNAAVLRARHLVAALSEAGEQAGAKADDAASEIVGIERLMRSAREAYGAGRVEETEDCYRQVLARREDHPQALAALGRLYMQQSRFGEAVDVLSRLNARQPGSVETMQMLGRALLQDGQLPAAAQIYEQCARIEPKNPDLWRSLGRIYRSLGDWAAGSDAWQQVLELVPGQVDAGLELAMCCERAGSPMRAEAALQQVLDRDPDNARALTMLARRCASNDPERALTYWRKLAALDTKALDPLLQIAVLDLRLGRSDDAEAALRAVLAREPDNLKALTLLVEIVAKLGVSEAVDLVGRWQAIEPASAKPWLALGKLHAAAKRPEQAREAFRRAADLEPTSVAALTALARTCREAGDYDGALECWTRIADIAPDPLHAKLQIARIHFARQDPQVEDVVRGILAVNPEHAEATRLMAYHYQRQFANFDDALEMWERLATHKTYGVEALIERARLYEKSRRDDLAEVEYKRALALDPRGRLPLSRMGNFYFGLNRFTDALKIYQVHREVEPTRTDVIVAMGVCLDRLDRFKEAEDLFAATLEREPENATVYAYRGRLLRARRQIDASVADFRRVCALRPDSAEAWQELVYCLASAEREEEALVALAEARETLGDTPESLVVLGRAAAAAQMDARAVEYFQQAIAAGPTDAACHAELGLYYFRQGVLDGALHHLLDARDLDSRDTKVARALFDTTSLLVELGYDPVAMRRGPRTAGTILSPEQLFSHARKLAEEVPPYEPVSRRVVAISSTLAPGGAERQLVTMLGGLSDPRFNLDLSLFCISLAPRYRRDFFLPALDGTSIDLVVLDMEMVDDYLAEPEVAPFASIIRPFPPDFAAPMAFWLREFRRRRPEVVHAWQDSTNLTAVVAALLAGVPRIILCCRSVRPDNPWRRLRRFMQEGYKAVLDHPSVILSNNSRAGADSYAEWLDIDTKSIEVVYNGIDFDRLANNAKLEETAQACADLGIPDGAPVLGGVFRMSEEKRPLLWLEVASLVAKAKPDAHFVICGDGPMRDKMNEFTREQGLADRVHLAGARSNIGSWYRLMDVVMLTSRHEGLPNVLLEAQSLGIPVVAPDVGGMAEVVEQGVTGWTIKNATAEMLAERVLHCLSDQDWRRIAIERAPRFIRERFGIETMLRRNLEVYGIPAELDRKSRPSGPAEALEGT